MSVEWKTNRRRHPSLVGTGIESIWALDLTILVSRLDAGHDNVQIAPLTVSCGPAASRRVARTVYAGRDNFIHFSKSYLLEPLGTRALHARRAEQP
jgi:hypothetical protein